MEEVELGAQQAAMLAHFESVFRAPGEEHFSEFGTHQNTGQFDDAEGDEYVEIGDDEEGGDVYNEEGNHTHDNYDDNDGNGNYGDNNNNDNNDDSYPDT